MYSLPPVDVNSTGGPALSFRSYQMSLHTHSITLREFAVGHGVPLTQVKRLIERGLPMEGGLVLMPHAAW